MHLPPTAPQEFTMQKLPDNPTRVLVLHAEAIVGFGLAAALGAQPGFEVQVGVAPDNGDFDVIVCDYDTGLRLARAARQQNPQRSAARLLVMTAQDREQAVRLALECGVHGYMLQGCPVDEFVTGVRTLARGQRFLSLAVAQRMADSMTREALTGREAEVLDLLACGQCNKSIARELQIAVGTVKAHVKAIMSKLEASSRTQAVSVAAQRGLVALQMPDATMSTPAFMPWPRAVSRPTAYA
jgi:DNA-binding NarL/FixJ family response regulator